MTLESSMVDRDPLARIASRRVIVSATIAVATGAFLASAVGARPDELPGIALESHVLLHLERALIVAGVIASALMFVLRGWAGYFPSKLSASGAEYADRSAVVEEVRNEIEILGAIADLDAKRLALARSLSEDLEALKRRVARVEAGERDRHDQ